MFSNPCQGLRSCTLHHPPVVAFFVCIVTLAAALLSLGAYLDTHPERDLDFTQNWDSLLHALSTKKICPAGDGIAHASAELSTAEDRANVSIMAAIRLSPWQMVVNYSSLQISATGTLLGLQGVNADAPITISLTSGWWSAQCNGSSTDCLMTYCIHVTGPQHLLPESRLPHRCPISNSSGPVLTDLRVVETEPSNSSSCYSLAYNAEPYLKNMLTEADVALCVQRLQYTGLAVFLLGLSLMVMFAFCTPPVKEMRTPGPL